MQAGRMRGMKGGAGGGMMSEPTRQSALRVDGAHLLPLP
jgi:hypothetical protein